MSLPLFVCGTQSLKDELIREGFTLTEDAEKTECIVMGFDTELNFKKLHDISFVLCTRELPYIATNLDYVCPTLVGKPEALMPQLAMARTGYEVGEAAVFGDRIYTDVKSGLNAGVASCSI